MQQELLIMPKNSNERIEELDSQNLELRKYINKLERQGDETRRPMIYPTGKRRDGFKHWEPGPKKHTTFKYTGAYMTC